MLKNIIGHGMECEVYETENPNVVFKLYFIEQYGEQREYTFEDVQRIVDTNAFFAEQGLAPEVLSGVIEIDGRCGYYVERVTPDESVSQNEIDMLVDALDIHQSPCILELLSNVGWTNDGRLVLFDFGRITLMLLGLKLVLTA